MRVLIGLLTIALVLFGCSHLELNEPMTKIPMTEKAAVIRTDFSDQAAWRDIQAEIRKPIDLFLAHIDFVDEQGFAGLTPDELLQLIPDNYPHSFLMVVDQQAVSEPEHPLLVIDLVDEPGRTFRAIPSQIQGIENNLWISNMDFFEFADHVEADGVFRGFK